MRKPLFGVRSNTEDANALSGVRQRNAGDANTLFSVRRRNTEEQSGALHVGLLFIGDDTVNEQGIYFPTSDFKDVIQKCGGQWNDKKERPLLCLIRSIEDPRLYWAIPMGDMAHRNDEQRTRIQTYLDMPKRDIRSCYYHIANTDKESLFLSAMPCQLRTST